jgi:cell division protein FtsL
MRVVLIFLVVVIFLFSLVYIESELVKLEVRKENLENRVNELRNHKEVLELEVIRLSNLAKIEVDAKKMGFFFPDENDILGIIK